MKKVFAALALALAAFAFSQQEQGISANVELFSGTKQRAQFLGIENDTVKLGGYVKNQFTVVRIHKDKFKSIECWFKTEDVLDLPVYLQINAGSLLNWKTRHIDKKVLKQGLPVVLGSDCHNMVHRPPNLQQGREMLTRKMGAALVQEMEETAERLLKEHAKA